MAFGRDRNGLPSQRTRRDPATGDPTFPSSVGAGGTERSNLTDAELQALRDDALDDDAFNAILANSSPRSPTAPAIDDILANSRSSHNFWTSPRNTYDPKTQFRFMVEIPGMGLEDARREGQENPSGDAFADEGVDNMLWYAKSCDKPGYSLTNLTEKHFLYDGAVADAQPVTTSPSFKAVSMSFVDPVYPNVTRKLARIFRRGGFQEHLAYNIAQRRGGGAESYIDTVEYVKIHQLDSIGTGRIIETWTLVDAYPIEVDWGKLDYSSNDLVEISVTWGYKTFTVEFPAIGNELAYKYYKDVNFRPTGNDDDDDDDDEGKMNP